MGRRALAGVVQLAAFAFGGVVGPAVRLAWHRPNHSRGPGGIGMAFDVSVARRGAGRDPSLAGAHRARLAEHGHGHPHPNSGTARDWMLHPKVSLVYRPWSTTELSLNAGSGFHSNDARGATTASVTGHEAGLGLPALSWSPDLSLVRRGRAAGRTRT